MPGSTDDVELIGMVSYHLEHFTETIYDFADNISTPFDMKNFVDKMEYIELQYHGDLTIDDISEVCFTSEEVKPEEKTIKILKEKGIKLFYYKDGETIEM